jgi:hypothetical protein
MTNIMRAGALAFAISTMGLVEAPATTRTTSG